MRLLLSSFSTRQLALLSSNAVPLLNAVCDVNRRNRCTRAQHTLSRQPARPAFQEAIAEATASASASASAEKAAHPQLYGIRIDPSARFVTLDLRSLGLQCDECETASALSEEERHRRLEMTLASSWLRAHCTCPECVDQRSFQRRYRETFQADLVDAGLISNTATSTPAPANPADAAAGNRTQSSGLESGDKLHYLNARLVSARVDSGRLEVAFQDGHKARFELSALHWMQTHSENEWSAKRVLWDRHLVEHELAAGRVKGVRFEDLLRADDNTALRALLECLVRYGAAFVDGTPATIEDTERAIRRVGNHVMRTHFGEMWSFKNETFDHPDTAYASIPLSAHIDLCSRDASAGLMCLHALKPAPEGEGGETLVVDGFRAAENLRKLHPQSFELLTRIPVDYEVSERSAKGEIVHLYRYM